MTEPSVANLRKASTAIYIAVEKSVADDISNLFKWAADEIERLQKALERANDPTRWG